MVAVFCNSSDKNQVGVKPLWVCMENGQTLMVTGKKFGLRMVKLVRGGGMMREPRRFA